MKIQKKNCKYEIVMESFYKDVYPEDLKDKTIKDVVVVYKNSNPSEILKILKNSVMNSVRLGIDESGDVYFWDASVLHSDMMRVLGKMWIATFIYSKGNTTIKTNDQYSRKAIEKMFETDDEFIKGINHLKKLNIKAIDYSFGKKTL